MLGISNGLVYEDFIQEQIVLDLTSISDLIGWWDFTDASSMYTDAVPNTSSNSGLTSVSSDGDTISLIDNKAYTQQSSTSAAFGKFMKSYKGMSSTSSIGPRYTTGGAGGYSYACFPGTDLVTTVNYGLICQRASIRGGVSSNVLSTSQLDLDDFTLFIVFTPLTDNSDNSEALGPVVFGFHNRKLRDTDEDGILDTGFSARFHIEQTPDSGGDYMTVEVSDLGTGTNVGSNIETTIMDSGAQLWTCVGSGSGDSKFYKNGNINVGVTNGNLGADTLGNNISPGMVLSQDSIFIGDNNVFGSSGGGQNESNWGGDGSDIDGSRVNAVYEVIFYNNELSSDDISSVETYLKNKYGIS